MENDHLGNVAESAAGSPCTIPEIHVLSKINPDKGANLFEIRAM
jgi:hypothetical protein